MQRLLRAAMLLGVFAASSSWTPTATGAAPAPSSYVGVEKIDRIDPCRPGRDRGAQDPNAPAGTRFFDCPARRPTRVLAGTKPHGAADAAEPDLPDLHGACNGPLAACRPGS